MSLARPLSALHLLVSRSLTPATPVLPLLALLLLLLPGCQQHATTQSESPLAAASTTTTNATDSAQQVVQLPAIPNDELIVIKRGQSLQLPLRTPAEHWQLDADPRFWQRRDTDTGSAVLVAITSGETELVQRERPERGGPAPRRFVYRLQISP